MTIQRLKRSIQKRPRQGFFLREVIFYIMLNYFREVRSEIKHVSWPTRTQAIVYTVVVIAVSLATAAYLGAWDYLFSIVIRNIIS